MAYLSWTAGFEGTPAGTDPGSVIANRFHDLKEMIRRIAHAAGINLPDIPPDHTGEPAAFGLQMVDAGGSGVSPAIWESTGSNKIMNPTDTGVDFPVVGSSVGATGGNITSGNNPGHAHDVTLGVLLGATALGRVPGAVFENRGNGSLTLIDARPMAWTAPSGGSVIVQMVKLAAVTTTTDPSAAAGTNVFSGGSEPTITTGNFWGSATTPAGGPDVLAVGDAYVFDITTYTAPAADIMLFLKVRRA